MVAMKNLHRLAEHIQRNTVEVNMPALTGRPATPALFH
jgi:hypothetical protein